MQLLRCLLPLLAGVGAQPIDFNIYDSIRNVAVQQKEPVERLASLLSAGESPLMKVHRELIEVQSISFNETSVSQFLTQYIADLGEELDLDLHIFHGTHDDNIYVYAGDKPEAKVLFTSHIDTVPPYIGYSLKHTDEGLEIHGRGSCDAKGSVAAQLIAYQDLIKSGQFSAEDLALLFVVGEEVGGPGMIQMDKDLIDLGANWEKVIFGEPTENKLAMGHKGVYFLQLEIEGHAAHSGYPDEGVDADKILIDIMHDLEHYDWPSSELLKKSTINIGLIDAGSAGNVVSPFASCTILVRNSVEVKIIEDIVDGIISKYAPSAVSFKTSLVGKADPVSLDYDVDGFETYVASYGTDIPNLTQRGFKRYLYGPGSILVAHGDNEFVLLGDLERAVEDYKRLALA